MDLVNLTPHQVDLLLDGGEHLVLPKCTQPLRLIEHQVGEAVALALNGTSVRLLSIDIAGAEALPRRLPDVLYVVPQLVARSYPERDDFVYPVDLRRDEAGNVTGAAAIARVAVRG